MAASPTCVNFGVFFVVFFFFILELCCRILLLVDGCFRRAMAPLSSNSRDRKGSGNEAIERPKGDRSSTSTSDGARTSSTATASSSSWTAASDASRAPPSSNSRDRKGSGNEAMGRPRMRGSEYQRRRQDFERCFRFLLVDLDSLIE